MTKQFQICIFEDDICKNITPYQLTRPTYTIPIGSANLVEKISQYAPDVPLTLLASKYHELFLKRRFNIGSFFLVNFNNFIKFGLTLFTNNPIQYLLFFSIDTFIPLSICGFK